ncbi:MAG: transposase [Prochlorococcaceae cyanobacterium]
MGKRDHLDPTAEVFLYLVAIMDLFSRHVLSWKLSNSLDTEFCLDALEMPPSGGRQPKIFHSDQGYQFTSGDFVARLQAEKIKISWSKRKRCYDNILVEQLWRTVKYEDAYLRAYIDVWDAEMNLARFLWRYCQVRPHSALGGKTPTRFTLRPIPDLSARSQRFQGLCQSSKRRPPHCRKRLSTAGMSNEICTTAIQDESG